MSFCNILDCLLHDWLGAARLITRARFAQAQPGKL